MEDHQRRIIQKEVTGIYYSSDDSDPWKITLKKEYAVKPGSKITYTKNHPPITPKSKITSNIPMTIDPFNVDDTYLESIKLPKNE